MQEIIVLVYNIKIVCHRIIKLFKKGQCDFAKIPIIEKGSVENYMKNRKEIEIWEK